MVNTGTLTDADIHGVATRFVMYGIQEWGQTDSTRIAVTQDVLSLAGFDAIATCGPVFGKIWPKECGGEDAAAATFFLKQLTELMPRGKFETEVDHVEQAIRLRRLAVA